MSSYPTLTDIEMRWRAAGSGVCVIVEGQTEQDDAWFYSRWFGDRAREVTFFPQDGWERVVDAVAELRVKLGATAVYGIIDRDFETVVGADPFPGSGVLRTPRYTLENYLLEAGCWFRCVQPYTLRSPKPGWQTAEDAQVTILGLYRQCWGLSAFNWTLKQARVANPAAFAALPEEQRTYRTHPIALANLGDVSGHLRSLGSHLGLTEDLGQVYQERLAHLQGLPQARLEEVVSGKYVHKLLSEQFPLRLSGKRSWDDMLSAYLFHCPAPPPDLTHLVTQILADAHSESAMPACATSGIPLQPGVTNHEKPKRSRALGAGRQQTAGIRPCGVLPALRPAVSPRPGGGGEAHGVLPLHRHGLREDSVRAALPTPPGNPAAGGLGQDAAVRQGVLPAAVGGRRGPGPGGRARGAGAPHALLPLHAGRPGGRRGDGRGTHPGEPGGGQAGDRDHRGEPDDLHAGMHPVGGGWVLPFDPGRGDQPPGRQPALRGMCQAVRPAADERDQPLLRLQHPAHLRLPRRLR